MLASLKNRLDIEGFDASLRLKDFELEILRNEVNLCYRGIVCAAGIEHHGAHAELFQKEMRLLSAFVVELVKDMPFMHTLRAELGEFTISDVVLPDGTIMAGREEIYWRVVRPKCPQDVGPAHRDIDFHKLSGQHVGRKTIKCWIPLWCEPDCGLWVGGRIYSDPGTVVLFGDSVYHQGVVNTGTTARVSIEITLVMA